MKLQRPFNHHEAPQDLSSRPMVDEFILGHLGRNRKFLGFPTIAALVNKRYQELNPGRHVPFSASCTIVASTLADLKVGAYVHLHTMLPFLRFAGQRGTRLDQGTPLSNELSRVCSTGRRTASFCPECVREDEGFWGFSYWRRCHQLPGRQWCDKHSETRLAHVPGMRSFEQLPGEFLGVEHEHPSHGIGMRAS